MSVFYSFHYDRDNWRVQQIMNMGAIEGTTLLNHQDWETVKRGGDLAIRNWIDSQMLYKSAVIVLVGYETAGRPWVQYEIKKAYQDRRPLLGIRINGLKDRNGYTDPEGPNPFAILGVDGLYVPLYTPSGYDSAGRYSNIRWNINDWAQSGYVRR